MRTVQFVTQNRGGPVDHAIDVARELARQGHESHVVTPDPSLIDTLEGTGIDVHTATVRHKGDLAGARQVIVTLDRIAPDVVHCQDRRAGLIGRLYGRRRGAPTVYTLHGVPDPLAHLIPGNLAPRRPRRGLRTVNFTAERWLARTTHSRVVTPCAALATYATEQVGISADLVSVVHNGVDPEWGGGTWAVGPPVASGPEDELMTVAWLGVMAPIKQVPALVRAAAAVPDVRLHLIGDGPERVRIEAEIRATGTVDRVGLSGFHSNPAPLLRQAHVLVLPSAAEAFPMAILQAMACGIPVIASAVGGIPELVRHEIDGLLVPPGDEQALAEALQQLYADPGLRRRMGAAARERLVELFTLERCVRGLVDVYGEVAA